MVVRKSEILENIDTWVRWSSEKEIYDVALLKIWIQFEKYLGQLFTTYCLGGQSETGFQPRLKIQFQDEIQFNAFMREGNKAYIEYVGRIEFLSKHIFETNPFDIILTTEYKTSFEQMKYLRNYIAHESEESRRKLLNNIFYGREEKFEEPNEYLKRFTSSGEMTYFTYYTKQIKDIIELLDSPGNTLSN
ncbi:hypothetical protein [Streptococcus oralis]|uniref:Uncharacterized protein n=1 Tax=Streptococcus oralis TaxID=1303 RepID=A0A3R9LRF1_STROR|nr:hypothetical protein [Streptococcus oralis]RSK09298.1 hypothetical protein D8804_04615 [Streptococcus oralis]